MKQHRNADQSGMALLMALMFITLALIAIGAMSARLMSQRLVVNQYEIYQRAFQGMEAAVAMAKVDLETGGTGIIGMQNWSPSYSEDNQPLLPDFGGNIAHEVLPEMPAVKMGAYAVNWFTDGRDNNGDGFVDNDAERFMFTIYAQAEEEGVMRRAEVVMKGGDVNVWRNAIFAGNGQAGGLINGNVSIHGSVHLLGIELPEGQTAIAAIDLSGTSLIHNNYDGIPASLAARVPPLGTVEHENETVASLEAKLRVKRGLVGLSGNSEVGSPHISGNSFKETMDGTHVTDGWTGNKTTPDGGRGIPGPVYSDNGHTELYDLGDKVPFPMLDTDWRDPDTGARVQNPATSTWYTHQEYFEQVLVADPAVPTDGFYNGNLTISTNTSMYWNATTNQYLTGNAADAAVPGLGDDYIQYNSSSKVMKVNGQVKVNGDLTLSGQGNNTTINYTGRAALLASGDVTIGISLLACNNGNPANTALSFPINNILGIMAAKNMYVGTNAQLDIMGAFYAQGMIKTQKQTNIMGTFVANYFDMGTNVPSIYQVPTLADNLPLGMIGNYPIMSLDKVSWRELGI